jgi:hypothetical protein
MSKRVRLAALPLLILCASCGDAPETQEGPGAIVDDAANAALRGAWTMQTRVTSIEYEGRRFSPALAREGGDLTQVIELLQRPVDLACAEPALVRSTRPGDQFVLACFANDAADKGRSPVACIADGQATLRVNGRIDAESGEVTVTIIPPPGGQRDTDRMTYTLTRTLQRTADCG